MSKKKRKRKTKSKESMDLPIISCESCGACCMHVGHPMFGNPQSWDPVWDTVPKDLQERHIRYMEMLGSTIGDDYGLPCYWLNLETRQCSHYEFRPTCCRDECDGGVVELGNESCHEFRESIGMPDKIIVVEPSDFWRNVGKKGS